MRHQPTKKPQPFDRTTTPEESLEEQIRYRAYELYEARGRQDGQELQDWFHAEIDITENTPSVRQHKAAKH